MGDSVNMVDPSGRTYAIPVEDVGAREKEGFTVPTADAEAARVIGEAKKAQYGGIGSKLVATGAGALRGGTAGLFDAAAVAIGGEDARKELSNLKEQHPGYSLVGDVIGSVVSPVGKIGGAFKAGEGATTLAKIGRAGLGGSVEGVAFGAGNAVSELALDAQPLTIEKIGSKFTSHMLFGGLVGGAAGSLAKAAEIGMTKARGAIDEIASGVGKGSDDALRATESKAIADDIAALRKEVKTSEQWATTKDLKMLATEEGRLSAAELGKMGAKAEKQLANVLDNPIGLTKNPTKALDALQRQENGLVKLLEHSDDLKAAYAVDGLGGRRLAALEAAPALLDKNRALQSRIESLAASAPSPATDMLGSIANKAQSSAIGMATGAIAGAVGAGPLGSLAAGAISKLVGEKVFGRLGKVASEETARTAQSVSNFLGKAAPVGEAVSKSVVPAATKTLATVKFAAEKPNATPAKGLAEAFHARAEEIRQQVTVGPDGKTMMRHEDRAAVAERLKPIAAVNPQLADQLETLAARRITFLADVLPKRPDILGAMHLGPDRWRPSDFEMRKWARYVAGVEDPGGIEERLAHGQVSVEDAKVMREVYPERLADLTRQIIEGSATLTKQLPYAQRLALSVLTGVPVVAALDPRIKEVLQGTFAESAAEQQPKPQFGSVSSKSAPEPTPAQQRSG